MEEPAIVLESLPQLPRDESVVWSDSDFAAALFRLEKLQEQVNSLKMALPMMFFNFADLRTGPDSLYRQFEQSAVNTTTTVANLRRHWADEQTQIILRRARSSAKRNPDSLLGTNRYMSLGNIFPDLYNKSRIEIKQESEVHTTDVVDIETAVDDISGIVEAYRVERSDFLIEHDAETDTIKVCSIIA